MYIDTETLKQLYKEKLIKNLIDKDRNLDFSKYAEEPCKNFNDLIDELIEEVK